MIIRFKLATFALQQELSQIILRKILNFHLTIHSVEHHSSLLILKISYTLR